MFLPCEILKSEENLKIRISTKRPEMFSDVLSFTVFAQTVKLFSKEQIAAI